MADGDQANILIVDDLPEKHLVYRSILEELGENLVSAYSGADALRNVLKSDFAVILLDVHMPDMDGFETAQMIRSRRQSAHTPIIFLTAFTDEMRVAQGYATGAVDYIPTPPVADILRAKVRVFVDLFRLRQQVARQAEEQARRAAAEETARRSAFLSEASRALAHSLDLETTLGVLANLAVPHLADLSLVALAGERGDIVRLQCSWASKTDAKVEEWLSGPIARAMASDRAELIEQLDPPVPLTGSGPSASPVSSVLVLPLSARGRMLGALVMGLGPSARCFSPTDVALAEELCGRAAIALDNALLVRDIQEADRRKNEFLAMLAHELRNPLAPIRSAAHVLKLRGPDQPELNWARRVIERQVTHLVRLVDDLLDVSRITRGRIKLQPEVLSVAEVVAAAVETSRPLIDAQGHQLTVNLPPEPLQFYADPARMAQVLANLLNNAAKYTPEKGRLTLSVERDGEQVVFRVRDNGMGIPPEMLERIFDLFTQIDHSLERSQGGLGIGLTMVRRLVEMHDGSVEARSDGPGRGSEFTVRLPLIQSPSSSQPSDGQPLTWSLGRLHPLRLLLVDDNVDAADGLARLLRLHGHEVQLAYTGAAALETARKVTFDVIVLDIGLPGMDGYELARRLREEPQAQGAVLVAVSGYGRDENNGRSTCLFDHHLTKPIEYAALERILPSRMPAIATPS